ncbi:binding-protein-dependent transport system inner membrane component, partial [mine drainage metagenome]
AIIFAEAISDFGVASTLAASAHYMLVPYTIYAALSNLPVNFAGAAGESLLLIVLALIIQVPQTLMSRGAQNVITGQRRQWRQRRVSFPATIMLALYFLIALGVPTVSFVLLALVRNPSLGFGPSHWTFSSFAQLLTAGAYAGPAMVRSYILSIATALLTTALGLWVMWSGSRLSALYDMLLTATIAVPGIVLAAAYVFAWNAPWVQGTPLALYGTYGALVLVYLAGGLPYSARLARVGLSQVDRG